MSVDVMVSGFPRSQTVFHPVRLSLRIAGIIRGILVLLFPNEDDIFIEETQTIFPKGYPDMPEKNIRIPIPRIPFAPPVYCCRRAPGKLVPDGDLEKDFWKDAPFTEDFRDIEGPGMPKPRFRTRARILWDDENLYIGALIEGNEIWAHQTEHDCVIFYDNDFEIFIDPDSDTQEYVEFEMNARNTYWDLLLTKAYRDGGSPVNGLEIKGISCAVKVCGKLNDPSADNRCWSVEVVIPFETLAECDKARKPPVPGSFYRMNFSRVQWKVDVADNQFVKRSDPATGRPLPEDNWVWAPTGVINIHYPELWAYVFFCGETSSGPEKAEAFVIPESEQVKWQLRKLYYAEQIHRDLHGCYTADVALLCDLLREYSPCPENGRLPEGFTCQAEVTSSFFELSAPVPGTSETVVLYADGKVMIR